MKSDRWERVIFLLTRPKFFFFGEKLEFPYSDLLRFSVQVSFFPSLVQLRVLDSLIFRKRNQKLVGFHGDLLERPN